LPCLPLKQGGQPAGVVSIQGTGESSFGLAFTADETTLLSSAGEFQLPLTPQLAMIANNPARLCAPDEDGEQNWLIW
jgi:hypothetical protein